MAVEGIEEGAAGVAGVAGVAGAAVAREDEGAGHDDILEDLKTHCDSTRKTT